MRPTRKSLSIAFALLICLFLLHPQIAPSLSTLVRLSRTIPGYIWAFMIQVHHKDDDADIATSMPNWTTCQTCLPKARYLSPRELMARPLQNPSNASIPKLIHQSWSDNELPLKFQEWSDTWRTNHPDWEWVLWTDADNRALVKNHFPWFKDSYEKLNGEIFKADAVRPLYMYAFGGIYADLDVECLRPFDQLFSAEIASSLANLEPSTSPLPCLYQYAYFGQMGTDANSWSSIPNAWMASTPHHPFFLMPIESVVQGVGKFLYYWYVEGLTGPHALFHQIKRYQSYQGDNLKLLSYLRTVHIPQAEFDSYNLVHSITVFEPEVIFPFSFMMADSDPRKKYCLMSGAKKGDFDRERCKRDLMVRENGSYCITYWSHTWTPHGHDGWNLGAVQE